MPATRARVVIDDPDRHAERFETHITVEAERLATGPRSERVACVGVAQAPLEHAADGGPTYRPGAEPGRLALSAFAVVSDLVARFEHDEVLGRPLRFRRRPGPLHIRALDPAETSAAYVPSAQVLCFGRHPTGALPARSFDVVCHEAGHAVFDALAPDLLVEPHPDCLAVHEAVADLCAMVAALDNRAFLDHHRLNLSNLGEAAVLARIGENFAARIGDDDAIRDLDGVYALPTETDDLPWAHLQPHARSLPLSSTIHALLGWLAGNLSLQHAGIDKVREQMRRFFFRALGYLPPGQIDHADFLRVLLAVDRMIHPHRGTELARALWSEAARRGIQAADSDRELGVDRPRLPGLPADRDLHPRSPALHAFVQGPLSAHLGTAAELVDVLRVRRREPLSSGRVRAVQETLVKVRCRHRDPSGTRWSSGATLVLWGAEQATHVPSVRGLIRTGADPHSPPGADLRRMGSELSRRVAALHPRQDRRDITAVRLHLGTAPRSLALADRLLAAVDAAGPDQPADPRFSEALQLLRSGGRLSASQLARIRVLVDSLDRPSRRFRTIDELVDPLDAWSELVDGPARTALLSGVARIEQVPSPFLNGISLGTAFVVAPNVLLTNRHVVESFASPTSTAATELPAHPPVRCAWQGRSQQAVEHSQVEAVLWVHPRGDAALLRADTTGRPPVQVTAVPTAAELGCIGHPVVPGADESTHAAYGPRDGRRQFSPGRTRGQTREVLHGTVVAVGEHDASTFRGFSGGPVFARPTAEVFGLHVGGVQGDGVDDPLARNWFLSVRDVLEDSDVQAILNGQAAPDLPLPRALDATHAPPRLSNGSARHITIPGLFGTRIAGCWPPVLDGNDHGLARGDARLDGALEVLTGPPSDRSGVLCWDWRAGRRAAGEAAALLAQAEPSERTLLVAQDIGVWVVQALLERVPDWPGRIVLLEPMDTAPRMARAAMRGTHRLSQLLDGLVAERAGAITPAIADWPVWTDLHEPRPDDTPQLRAATLVGERRLCVEPLGDARQLSGVTAATLAHDPRVRAWLTDGAPGHPPSAVPLQPVRPSPDLPHLQDSDGFDRGVRIAGGVPSDDDLAWLLLHSLLPHEATDPDHD